MQAVGVLTEALETVERARGHLYEFHQLTGRAEEILSRAVEALRAAGHHRLATGLQNNLVGRNVLPDRWTFQVIEEYNCGYYQVFADLERCVRAELTAGRQQVAEDEMKQRHRTNPPSASM
ncbi:MAG: hypothetical protein ACRDRG_06480 [Pseudonocardiaceae bacterium]